MKQRTVERLAAAAFVTSLGVIAIVYGTVAGWQGWFPAPQVERAYVTLLDLSRYWKNDLALEPTRHLVAPDDSGRPPDPDRGYVRHAATEPEPGYVLIAGLSDDQDTSAHAVRMFDRNGGEVFRWPVFYELLDRKVKPQNVMLHGMEVFADGSLAVTFDSGNAIARIDACGRPIWSTKGEFHHSIARDGQGALVTWRGETMVWLDEDTGEELSSLDLRRQVIPAAQGKQRAIFNIRTRTPDSAEEKPTYFEDPFHPNDAEPLRADMADAFPMFDPGDVLFSLRELNLVGVVDPDSGRLKWWKHGPWFKQHDPDFEPDGTITVLDNATGTGRSLIRRVDPADNSVSVVFAGSEAQPFYTWRRGKHQMLPNGNVLVTEAEHGRVFEADPQGRIVWERPMVWDADHNLIVTEARYVPETFFAGGRPHCAASGR